MYVVYILQSLKDKRTHAGYTNEIHQRLHRHNTGQVIATKNRKPLRLLFTEEFLNIQKAKAREAWWKSSTGRRTLKKLFQQNGWGL